MNLIVLILVVTFVACHAWGSFMLLRDAFENLTSPRPAPLVRDWTDVAAWIYLVAGWAVIFVLSDARVLAAVWEAFPG